MDYTLSVFKNEANIKGSMCNLRGQEGRNSPKNRGQKSGLIPITPYEFDELGCGFVQFQ